jgi:ATP:cob(I)alamin adenosyltransferase
MAARAARLARTAARAATRPEIPPAAVEAHAAAVARGLQTYDDPTTGYTVFTELAHRARGGCCGRMCRHCCYGWRNVRGFATEKPTRASRVYTRKGDGGRARLVGSRDAETPKFATVYEAVGDVDELGVKLGIAAFHTPEVEGGVDVRSRLLKTQALLLDAGATLTVVDRSGDGAYASAARDAFDDAEIASLEEEVDALDAALPPLKNFVVATGPLACLALHDARVVCRRAERHVWRRAEELRKEQLADDAARVAAVAKFLNRLSDYLFVAARGAAATDVVYDVSANVRRRRREKDEEK